MSKLQSRKFWMSVAAMLASVGTAIAGAACANETLVAIGVACTAISAGIYAAAEAYVDASAALAAGAQDDDEEEEDAE